MRHKCHVPSCPHEIALNSSFCYGCLYTWLGLSPHLVREYTDEGELEISGFTVLREQELASVFPQWE